MISCKEYVAIKKSELKEKISKLKRPPVLKVFLKDGDMAASSYLKGIKKDADEVGIIVEIKYLHLISEMSLSNVVSHADGIICLSKCDDIRISEYEDVDGLFNHSVFKPCTPTGIINYLKYNNYDFEGKDIVVIGRSERVGKPLAKMLTDLDATVTLCHSKTEDMLLINKMMYADLVISCIDKVDYFGLRYITQYPDYIDTCIGVNKEGQLMGSLTEYAVSRVKYYNNFVISGTNGVGLLTRLELMNNVYEAYLMNNGGEHNE